MEEAIRNLLLSHGPISGLVGQRVDWGVRVQGAPLPALTIHQISGRVDMHLRGASGWYRDLAQFECWGGTFFAARNLANMLAGDGGLLVGYRGVNLGVQLRTFIIGRRSDSDTDSKGPVHRASVDVMIWHRTTD
ncbi:DUF3168 domain-containing protein [Novosphingobium sp. BW1]|uniref:DUF3168 domain-containing protein n=1 Tax=Novosphingobium sp. BW1 TaxID=2592621 RepID=UPI0011DE7953|nr:DUF3168 domain-containing protein [Novosphingobium sp. BW1]TYC93045.1 DUF3168 domain-containing protein [Novosphingobium sp. BW1]